MVNIRTHPFSVFLYGGFLLVYFYSLAGFFFVREGAILFAAAAALPTMQLVGMLGEPLLDAAGPFGSPPRRLLEWTLIFVAGFQYLVLGLFLDRFLKDASKNESVVEK